MFAPSKLSKVMRVEHHTVLHTLVTFPVGRVEHCDACKLSLALFVRRSFRVACNGEMGVSCMPRKKVPPMCHRPRSCAHQRGAGSPLHKSPLPQVDKKISKSKIKKLVFMFTFILFIKMSKKEDVWDSVSEGVPVTNFSIECPVVEGNMHSLQIWTSSAARPDPWGSPPGPAIFRPGPAREQTSVNPGKNGCCKQHFLTRVPTGLPLGLCDLQYLALHS